MSEPQVSSSGEVTAESCSSENLQPRARIPASASDSKETGSENVTGKPELTIVGSDPSPSDLQPKDYSSQSSETHQDEAVNCKGQQSDKGGRKERKICLFYERSGWCRYGKYCRYLHPKKKKASASSISEADDGTKNDQNDKDHQPGSSYKVTSTDDAKSPETSSCAQPVCKFFARAGWCRYGYKCRFAHVKGKEGTGEEENAENAVKADNAFTTQENAEDEGRDVTEMMSRLPVSDDNAASVALAQPENGKKDAGTRSAAVQQNQTKKSRTCHFYARGYCQWGKRCRFLHETIRESKQEHPDISESVEADSAHQQDEGGWQPAKKPVSFGSIMSRPLTDLKDGDATQMRETEINQLKKRFPGDKLVITTETDNPSYRFSVVPTDPDWPYDLKEFELEMVFPKGYPIEHIQLSLPVDQVLPTIILRHISEAITEWLDAKYATNQLSGRVELVVRPFLRWFDRNLMRLFTEGARKFKKEVYAKAAGFEFISYAKTKDDDVARQATYGDREAPAHPKEEFINQEVDGQDNVEEEYEEEEYDDDAEKEDDDDDDDDDEDEYEESQVDLEASASRMFALSTESQDVNPAHPAPGSSGSSRSRYESPTDNRRGTEVSFPRLEMSESAATLACHKIKLRVQCSRCRDQTDLSVVPGIAMVLGCPKCQNQQAIGFRPCLLHQFSSVLGFLDLTGCAPVDLIVYDCSFIVSCLSCSEETNVQGIQYGQNRLVWCSRCHQKISLSMETARFQKLVASVPEGKAAVVSVKKDRRQKDPAIKEGFPLPDNGICKHYKKSYRWLRFPCCGKCYPCDECHDLAEMDHDMLFASRMICGFCSKEQPYSVDKPCISCGSNTTKARTTHWEGGTGCRNRTKMSRSDKQKYSGVAKTTSRKAQKVEDLKKGKKKK